jgi:hypothetical protein
MKTLSPGLYVLAKDVTNPHPDRRKSRTWTAEVTWPAGMKLVLSQPPGALPRIHRYGGYESDCLIIFPSEERARHGFNAPAALLEQLTPVPVTTVEELLVFNDEVLYGRGLNSAVDVLQRAVDRGMLTLDGIRALLADLQRRDDAEGG